MINKSVVAGVLALALLAGTGVVFAASPDNAQSSEPSETRVRIGRMFGAERLCESIGQDTGLLRDEICAARSEGLSIEEFLAAKGVDAKAFFERILSERKAQLDEYVTSGQLSPERAETALNNITERLNTGQFPVGARHRKGHGRVWFDRF